MKKIKRLFLSIILVMLSVVLVACSSTYKVTFKDWDGTVIEVVEVAKGEEAKAPNNPKRENYVFDRWDKDITNVTSDMVVNAIYVERELDTRYADSLKLETSTTGKEFIRDGIGEIRLNRVVDGDTISVYTAGSSEAITIRFLGINTPESTGTIEPWGKAASAYAKEVLYNAYSIALESEGERKDSGGKRWLAWVWYKKDASSEYRLFNLEELELSYTKYNQQPSSKYHSIFLEASQKTQKYEMKVFGEKDPNFNYSKDVIETSLLNLWCNHSNYQSGTYFYVTVRLVRTIGNNMYLEDAEEVTVEIATDEGEDPIYKTGKGHFYAFSGYAVPYYKLYNIGDVFQMRCQLEWDSDYGTQLTGLSNPKNAQASLFAEPEITVVDANNLKYSLQTITDKEGNQKQTMVSDLYNYFGQVITVQNLKCIDVKEKKDSSGDTYYTAYMENASGVKFDVYFNKSLITAWKVGTVLEPGKTYNITGGIAYYEYANGLYQISVGDGPRYNKGVLNEHDVTRINDIVEVK